MPRFKLTIEYAGTRYSGWQIQKNARTIQGEIDRAIRVVTGAADVELYGAGRTDAGVHALGQVAHLEVRTALPAQTLRRRLNDELPPDINVLAAHPVPHRFHARHDARSRIYLYQIARRRTAFGKPFVWWVRDALNLSAMRDAAGVFEGFQNFAAFTHDDPEEKSTDVALARVQIDEAGAMVLVRVEGSHFLWKMVRRIVGVLVAVGQGDLRPRDVATLMTGTSEAPARLTAPPSGLFLERVVYASDSELPDPPPLLNLQLADT
jgi:tRNA pseudouridine38-40 synthase